MSGGSSAVTMGWGAAADGLRARYAPAGNGLYYQFEWDPQGSLAQRQTGGPGGNTTYPGLDTAMYDGYGQKLGDTDAFTGGAEPQRDAMGFQGQWGAYTDLETGLVLMGRRYYDPGTGRFLTRDPLGYGGGVNLYGFTGNNPVNEMDPSGLEPGQGESDAESDDIIGQRLFQEIMEAREEEREREANFRRGFSSLGTAFALDSRSVMRAIADFRDEEAEKDLHNLFPSDAPYEYKPSTLEFRSGKYVEITPSGEVRSATGRYIFITKRGVTFIARVNIDFGRRWISHIDLAKGEAVEYAGEIQFGRNGTRGILKSWNNASGHYQPFAIRSYRAGLPLAKFEPTR